MSEEIKPCPFCGSQTKEIVHYEAPVKRINYQCSNWTLCPLSKIEFVESYWNCRPVEDGIRTQLVACQQELEQTKERMRQLEQNGCYTADESGHVCGIAKELGEAKAEIERLKEEIKN